MIYTYLGYEFPFDYEALIPVNAALRAQLRHHELEHVVRRTIHHLADLLEVGLRGNS
jgi:hypothetical protein